MKIPSWLFPAMVIIILLATLPDRLKRREARYEANKDLFEKINLEGGISSPTLLQILGGIGILFGFFYYLGAWR